MRGVSYLFAHPSVHDTGIFMTDSRTSFFSRLRSLLGSGHLFKRRPIATICAGTIASLAAFSGGCSTASPCPIGYEAINGACYPVGSSTGSSGCQQGFELCNGACVDVMSNSTSCGTCGNSCSIGSSCAGGSCVCQSGRLECGAGCTDPMEDTANCGMCGTICSGATPFCSGGACAATCGAGLEMCGTICANVQTSENHCGTCGNSCANGTECISGMCTCPAGTSCDGGVPPLTGSGGGPGGGSGGAPGGTGSVGNSGGMPGTGSTSGTGSSTGDGGPYGGYHVHGDWAGFAFTFATDATITPSNFEDMIDQDGPYCVSGSVKATESYGSIAAVGFNVSQPKTDNAEVKVLSANGDGLLVDITINTLTPPSSAQDPSLRIQLEDLTDPSSPDAGDHRWCANVQPVAGKITQVIPWTSFNTMCWDGTGDDFDPATTKLAKVIIYAPDAGEDGNEQQFDFCVNDIGPDNVTSRGTGTIMASCPSNGTMWTNSGITEPFAKIGSGSYQFQSNLWNPNGGGQSLSLIPGGGFKFDQQTCATDGDAPCSFPSVYIGTNSGGDARSAGYQARQISAINSIPTCLGWSSGGTPASDQYNVSYDVWFSGSANGVVADKFLMVWFRDPPGFQPGGMFPVADGVVIGDQTWQVWDGLQHEGRNVISYVAPNGLADGQAYSFDLKDFIDDAVEREVLSPSQYLISVMGGMEVWGGARGASLTGFTAEVQ